MAPITPVSRKRSTPSDSEDGHSDESSAKRRRVEVTMPHTPPPEENSQVNFHAAPMFSDDPHQLLTRSAALVLEHVGFSGAQKDAMEAFCAEIDAFSTHFLSKVTSSMLNCRRSQPTPVDFAYALQEFDIPLSYLEPHLEPPIPESKSLVQLQPVPEEQLATATVSTEALLGEVLSGDPDKTAKPYIPKRFPSFPSKHTYRSTLPDPARVMDPRKIREEAAKAARQGEDALRSLTRVAKAGKEKDVKNTASKDPTSKERHTMWELAMETLATNKSDIGIKDGVPENDRGLIVNAGRAYNRKGAPAKKKILPVLEGL
ncbi:hypothetical protein LZ554_000710 [Drepanopeziza brunnea f. sp. 'monogermtubi']|nr:hypothetical protein LZ554_000710 [Drepanopeziza brunnea f. sp. 'monogermtubi']